MKTIGTMSKNVFGPKNVRFKKIFGSKTILGQKSFGSKEIWSLKKFWFKKFGSKRNYRLRYSASVSKFCFLHFIQFVGKILKNAIC